MSQKPYPFHPLANEYPHMSDTELDELAADIEANGQRVPVVYLNDLILDGRNRHLACERLGIDSIAEGYVGLTDEDSLRKYIASLNEHRRHLTPEWLSERRRRRIERVTEGRRQGKSLPTLAEEEGVSLGQIQRDLQTATLSGDKVGPSEGKVTGRDGRVMNTENIGKTKRKKKPTPNPSKSPDRSEEEPSAAEPRENVAQADVPPADMEAEPEAVALTFCPPDELREVVVALAKSERRTVAQVLQLLVEEALMQRGCGVPNRRRASDDHRQHY
jgi:hypothetical protein